MAITYAMTATVLIIGLALMLADSVYKLKESAHKLISVVLIGTTIFYVLMDCLWIQVYVADDFIRPVFVVLNTLFYLVYITLPFIWFLFAQHFAANITHRRKLMAVCAIPWLFNLFLVVATCFGADFLWTIGDAASRYGRGPLFGIFSNLNLVYYFVPVVEIIVFLCKRKNADRRMLLTTLGFSVIPAAGVLIYTYFISVDAIYPFQPCCFFIGVMFAYIMMLSQAHKKAQEENLRLIEAAREAELTRIRHEAEIAQHEAERHQHEAEIARLESEQAQLANEAKTTFLFNMSHDIRTPMNAITGFTAMAKKHIDEPETVSGYLDKIDISGKQLLSLINQVLEMSRIESGKIALEEESVNLVERHTAMVTVIESQAAAHGLLFEHFQEITHENIYSDDSKMNQIILNIAGNAIKFTPEGGKITYGFREIPCEKEGYASYVLSLQDTGIGMSEEFLKTIFEPFSREKTSTVSKIQGTGLGMSIVKELVTLMGGEIQVRSAQGEGTTIEITLSFRIDTRDAKKRQEEKAAWSRSDFEGKRILLVEDNEMNREIASYILKEHGMVIEEAVDGTEAVAMVEDVCERGDYRHYDLVLMDIQMPRMNGFDATRAIRAIDMPDDVHIPIVAMTANAFEEDKQKAFEAGMDAHLAKPIDVEKMLSTLAGLM